ncbi:MAG: phosphatidylserine decarboxylase [Nitrospirae bacterium CG_4_9_14_3_um_filter_53_35]|nr:MAG: phosphatidylserine decarboxylase [Nitrospirae bacterium CG2_30_53_67]PIS37626.1 MAG: phosphatidylserine decarboxylase [Nitrospirae bacterium CG08_land_8_20_14_0_20_52_24]PIW86002.1 MAG: phosphatidylserine decarboxylase [Nitrospirae bacterium CG_4_8_14_3_um_filter_50_41]PJA76355.1 MAG: phosphatidylserine decarboxylase [Nitrospirae bacterium CG_4_9_14_3_um_filter_53_35]
MGYYAKKLDHLFLRLLYLLPKHLISRITGWFGRIPLPFPLNLILVRAYAALYHVNLSEAELPPSQYHTLNAFFVRKLKPSVRPIDPDPKHILSPVDGTVIRSGPVSNGTLLQAKAWTYTLRDLLGGPERAADFLGGSSVTLYLSPSDYHRIHVPADAEAEALQYIPGRLFPVNRYSLDRIKNLFVINERLVVHMKTGLGQMAMVMVGAVNVGKIRITFDEIRNQVFHKGPFLRRYRPAITLRRGEEMGRFELGSTVILLFEKDRVELTVQEGQHVRVGEPIGIIACYKQ